MNPTDWINRRTAAASRGRLRPVLPVVVSAVLFAALFLHARLLLQIWPPCRDLDLRINEIRCVLSGVDPYDVFHGTVISTDWRPFDTPDDPLRPRERVNGYAPWEYTFLLPLAAVPKQVAFRLWTALSAAAAVAFWLLAAKSARDRIPGGRTDLALWAGTISLLTTKAVPTCILCGNFGVFLPLFALGMARALNHRRDIVAGIFLALLMAKPQAGLLFFLPPLVRGRWRTIATAGSVLFAAALPPALLCRKSPLDLIVHLAGHGEALARATGLVPPPLFERLMPVLGASGVLAASALAGIALCCAALRMLRSETDWIVLLSPPALFATLWTYSLGHDRCLDSIPLLVASIALLRATARRERLASLALVAAISACGFLVWQSIPPFYPMHRIRLSFVLARMGIPLAESAPNVPDSILLSAGIALLVLKILLAFRLWASHPPSERAEQTRGPLAPVAAA